MTKKIKLLLFSVTVCMAVLIFFSLPINLGFFTTCTDAYARPTPPVGGAPEPSVYAVASLVWAYIAAKKLKK